MANRLYHMNNLPTGQDVAVHTFETQRIASSAPVHSWWSTWDTTEEYKQQNTVAMHTYSFFEPDMDRLHENAALIRNQRSEKLHRRGGKTTTLLYMQMWFLQTLRHGVDSRHVFVSRDRREADRDMRLFWDLVLHDDPNAVLEHRREHNSICWTEYPTRRAIMFTTRGDVTRHVRGTVLASLVFDDYLETVRFAPLDRSSEEIQGWIQVLGLQPGESFLYT